MKTRIISGVVMLPLLIVLYFRGIPLAIAAFIIGAVGMYELFNGFKNLEIKPNIFIGIGLLVLLYIFHFIFPGRHDILTFWIVISVVITGISLFPMSDYKIEDALSTLLGVIYVGFLSYHIVMIDETSYGILIWMVVITAFCTDIFAYFTGYFLGRVKLCPNLSPKKTVEGAVGGVVGTIIISIIFALITKIEIFPHIMLMGLIGAVMSELGDLTASAFKRKMGIKDYGNLIPGHGGVLDRFDSILFTAPTIYYYLTLVIRR